MQHSSVLSAVRWTINSVVRCRPDSNALATDDDQQAAILKNTHSIPNGTAAGAHGLQP